MRHPFTESPKRKSGCKGMRIHGGTTAFLAALAVLALFVPSSSGKARLDRGFGEGGVVSITSKPPHANSTGGARALAETGAGDLLVLGNESSNYPADLLIARLNPGGRLDRDFANQGIRYTRGLPSWHPTKTELLGMGTDLAVGKRGGIFTAGYGGISGGCVVASGFFPNGALKIGFGDRGRSEPCLRVPYPSKGCQGCTTIHRADASSISLDGKGRVVIGGQSYRGYRSRALVMRLTRRGRLDPTFSGNRGNSSGLKGAVEVRPRTINKEGDKSFYESELAEARPLRHQKVLAVGSIDRHFAMYRFRANGVPDRSFHGDGILTLNLDKVPDPENQCGCSYATGVDFDRKGRVLVAGYIRPLYNYNRPQPVVLRFLKSGRLDRSFGRKGMAKPRLPKRMTTTRIAIQDDGKIVVGGRYDQRFGLFRLNPGGALDRSFFRRGLFAPEDSGLGAMATDLLIDRRGRIVATGGGHTEGMALVRIRPG